MNFIWFSFRWTFFVWVILSVPWIAYGEKAAVPEPTLAPAQAKPEPPAPGSFHPIITLRDAEGNPVFESNKPVSSLKTCDGCHDVSFIETHSYHSNLGIDEITKLGQAPSKRPWDFGPGLFGRWDPITYDVVSPPGNPSHDKTELEWLRGMGGRHIGGGPLKEVLGQDCLVCHVQEASPMERARGIAEGNFSQASMLTLIGTGLVVREKSGEGWDKDRFLPDGRVTGEMIGLGRPANKNCGACHALVSKEKDPVKLTGIPRRDREQMRMFETQGMVFSGQRISDSAVNLVGKDRLTRPWDVHAERMVACVGCHFSPNNPTYAFSGKGATQTHLFYDARHEAIGNYLRNPDHNFAKGFAIQGTVANALDGKMRQCGDCHDAMALHKFLPRAELHFQNMRCESCHIPKVTAPARSETDYTLLAAPSEPRVTYRGISGSIDDPNALVEGFVPLLLPSTTESHRKQLVPSNVILTWFWVEQGPEGDRPVPKNLLNRAFFIEKDHHPELLRGMDQNHDGKLIGDELILDTRAKITLTRERLVAAGARNPRLTGEIQPFSLGHGIVSGRFVTRECASCHSEDSRVDRDFILSNHAPAGVMPTMVGDSTVRLAGAIVRDGKGGLIYKANAKTLAAYIPGAGQYRLVDGFGLLMFISTALGVTGHGLLRLYASRRRRRSLTVNEEKKP